MIFKRHCNPIYFGKVFLFSIITSVVSQLHIKVDANTIWCWRKIAVAITTLLIFLSRFCVFSFLSIHLFSNGFRGYSSSVKNAIIKDLIGIQIHFWWQPMLDIFGSTEPRLYSCWDISYKRFSWPNKQKALPQL